MTINNNIKPFLKWAGGKTQLLPVIKKELPENLYLKTNYVEPFLGAGAVFFDFLVNDMFETYVVNDINTKLINVYLVIRDSIDSLVLKLNKLKDDYLSLEIGSKERDEMFYSIRDKFNDEETNLIDLAAYFIFLNKTCFNGLYRENKKGGFNVPTGRYKNPSIFKEEQLREISALLNKKDTNNNFVVTILNVSFDDLASYIDKNTFVYLDPPYRPVTVGGFSAYDKSGFNDESQKLLANFFSNMSNKKAKLMLSNSNPRELNENDDFFEVLYKNFNIKKVYASRMINSNGKGRGKISELLITNYDK